MALYNYKCTSEDCNKYNEPVQIIKPMSKASDIEKCSACNKEIQKIFGSFGLKTAGDIYKS